MGSPRGNPRASKPRGYSLYMHLRKALFYRDIFSANWLYAAGRSCIGPTTVPSMAVSSKRNRVDKRSSTHDSTHVFWLEESVSAQHFEFWSRDPNHERVPIQPRPGYAPAKKTTHNCFSNLQQQQPQKPQKALTRSQFVKEETINLSPFVRSTSPAERIKESFIVSVKKLDLSSLFFVQSHFEYADCEYCEQHLYLYWKKWGLVFVEELIITS